MFFLYYNLFELVTVLIACLDFTGAELGLSVVAFTSPVGFSLVYL